MGFRAREKERFAVGDSLFLVGVCWLDFGMVVVGEQ